MTTKEEKRAVKAARAEQRKHRQGKLPGSVDVGCVLHGRGYDWIYVERLYNMVSRHMPVPIRFHVWTEHDRSVPPHMIKHILHEWPGVSGPRKSWWYKMQMFDSQHHHGDLLYFDLDVVITGDLSWIVQETTDRFWILRDFRYLQNPRIQHNVNSSIMWWNVPQWQSVWDEFSRRNITDVVRTYHGDQDLINALVPVHKRQFLDDRCVQSWRWQAHDGGWDFRTRKPKSPGLGTVIDDNVSVLIFHGKPKPHQIEDPLIAQHWC